MIHRSCQFTPVYIRHLPDWLVCRDDVDKVGVRRVTNSRSNRRPSFTDPKPHPISIIMGINQTTSPEEEKVGAYDYSLVSHLAADLVLILSPQIDQSLADTGDLLGLLSPTPSESLSPSVGTTEAPTGPLDLSQTSLWEADLAASAPGMSATIDDVEQFIKKACEHRRHPLEDNDNNLKVFMTGHELHLWDTARMQRFLTNAGIHPEPAEWISWDIMCALHVRPLLPSPIYILLESLY